MRTDTGKYFEEAFEELVAKCKKNNSAKCIHNRSSRHALFALKKLLEVAYKKQQVIRLVSGNLGDTFYGQLNKNIKSCLQTGCSVELVITYPSTEVRDSSFIQTILSNGGHVKQAQDASMNDCPHFMLVGNKSFRLETNHELSEAEVCFNDSVIGRFLLSKFKDLLSNDSLKEIRL